MHRSLAALVAVVGIAALTSVAAVGTAQAQEAADGAAWTLPRTPDGQPDMQGYWTTQTFTPVERPERLADQEFFTDEELALLQRQLTAEGVDPLRRDAVEIEDPEVREEALYQDNREASYVHYDNQVWLRTPVPKGLSTRRTSLLTYPRNGRFPPMTPQGAARVAHERAMRNVFDGYETRPLMERCIIWAHEGPPMLPPAYNDIHQIFQTPDHIVLFTEIGTGLPRIIPLDDRPHLPRDRSPVRRQLARALGGRHPGRRDEELHRAQELPRLEPVPARRGALHPRRRGADPLRGHRRRSDDLDEPLERRGPDAQDRRADVRVRLPRGQPRHPPHPRDQPQPRASGGRGGGRRRLEVALRGGAESGMRAGAVPLAPAPRRRHTRVSIGR